MAAWELIKLENVSMSYLVFKRLNERVNNTYCGNLAVDIVPGNQLEQ